MKAALLLSGGMDSVALAYWKRPVLAVTVDYGQRAAEREVAVSAMVAESLGIEHRIVRADLSHLGAGDLAGKSPSSLNAAPDWWPYRNQMLVTLSAMAVVEDGVEALYIGTVATDDTHLDGTRGFVASMDALLRSQEGGMRFDAPAIGMTTVELVMAGGIPPSALAWAYSCHNDILPCGECSGCRKYAGVFAELRRGSYFA